MKYLYLWCVLIVAAYAAESQEDFTFTHLCILDSFDFIEMNSTCYVRLNFSIPFFDLNFTDLMLCDSLIDNEYQELFALDFPHVFECDLEEEHYYIHDPMFTQEPEFGDIDGVYDDIVEEFEETTIWNSLSNWLRWN